MELVHLFKCIQFNCTFSIHFDIFYFNSSINCGILYIHANESCHLILGKGNGQRMPRRQVHTSDAFYSGNNSEAGEFEKLNNKMAANHFPVVSSCLLFEDWQLNINCSEGISSYNCPVLMWHNGHIKSALTFATKHCQPLLVLSAHLNRKIPHWKVPMTFVMSWHAQFSIILLLMYLFGC